MSARGSGTVRGLSSRARSAQDGRHWPLPGGAAAEEERRRRPNRGADERRGEQIVLRLTSRPILACAAGLADAWSPLRAYRNRRSHRRAPLTSGAARDARPPRRPHGEVTRHPCAPRAPPTPSKRTLILLPAAPPRATR